MKPTLKKNLKNRILACLVDYLIYGLFYYAYLSIFGKDEGDGTLVVRNSGMLPVILVWVLYFPVLEGLTGATLGHQVFNLKVLKVKGDEIGIGDAILRHLFDPIDIFFYGIPAFIAIRNSDKHQRLGDMVAGTIVVNVNDPIQYQKPDKRKVFNRD